MGVTLPKWPVASAQSFWQSCFPRSQAAGSVRMKVAGELGRAPHRRGQLRCKSKDSFRCQELTWCGLLLDEPLERSGQVLLASEMPMVISTGRRRRKPLWGETLRQKDRGEDDCTALPGWPFATGLFHLGSQPFLFLLRLLMSFV